MVSGEAPASPVFFGNRLKGLHASLAERCADVLQPGQAALSCGKLSLEVFYFITDFFGLRRLFANSFYSPCLLLHDLSRNRDLSKFLVPGFVLQICRESRGILLIIRAL